MSTTEPDDEPRGEVELTFTAPVHVTVDMDQLEVTRVWVEDENVTYDSSDNSDAELTDAALDIAEVGMWPGWEFGP